MDYHKEAIMYKGITLFWDKEPDIAYGSIKFHHVYHDYPVYHGHDYYEFFLCSQGGYRHIINDQEVQFKRLEGCLTALNAKHKVYEAMPNSSHYSVAVRKEDFEAFSNFIDSNFLSQLNEKGYLFYSLSEARMKKIISYLNQVRESKDVPHEREIATKFLLFNLLEPMIGQSQFLQAGKRPEWLNDLLIEINNPENLSWDVSDAVAHSHYSKTHLARLFKEEMGKSIGEYLQEVKINNARDILVNSDMSLAELCDVIGHSSLSHFSNVFKHYYGMAPGKYRAAHRIKE